MRQLRSLARAIGAKPKQVGDESRVLYHAAAVYASNFVDVVVAEAVRLLEQIGWSEDEATRALMPLVEGAVANIRRRSVVGALTGPIRRGDAETVQRHIEALRNLDVPIRPGRFAAGPPSPASGGRKPSAHGLFLLLGPVSLRIPTHAGPRTPA